LSRTYNEGSEVSVVDDPPKMAGRYTDTLLFHSYGVKINLNGEEQLLRLSVRETKNHEYFYDAHNTRIEDIKIGLSSNNIDRRAKTADVDKSLSRDKLYQWLKFVKY